MSKDKQTILSFIKTLAVLAIVCCFIMPSVAISAVDCSGPKQKCSAGNSCMAHKDSEGKLPGLSSNQVSSACLKSTTEGGCFDSVPMSSAGSYNTIGYRPNGAGGNTKPRNHNGSDIGTGGDPNVFLYAPADGVVVQTVNNSSWSGRTMVLEHTKGCIAESGDKPKYSTQLRHLYKFLVSAGTTVKKGDTIGIVGGSNYVTQLCDNKAQVGNHCSPAYAIHLHIEVLDGKANPAGTGTGVGNRTIVMPYCGELQAWCGCSPVSTSACANKIEPYSNGESATGNESGIDGSGGAGGGGNGESSDSCNIKEYLDSDSCLFCGLFRVIFNSASSMAKTAIDKLSAPSKNLVILGFMIWICLQILKQISSFKGADSGQMLKGIIFQGFRVVAIVFILSGSIFQVMDLTLNPVIQTGLTFSQSLNSNSSCDKNAEYMQKIIGYKPGEDMEKASGGLPHEMGQSIICSIKNLEDSISVMSALGNYSICIAFNDKAVWGFLPHLGFLGTGLMLWLSGIILLLAFPWCLIDCILQLCIAAAMIPCSVAAYAFKSTAKYISITWNFFMNAMFNILFMAIIIFVINSMFLDWIGLSDNDLSGAFDNERFIRIFGDGLAWYGPGAMKILFACFLFWVYFDEAKEMADKFAKGAPLGGKKGIGRMVGGTVAQGAGAVGKAAYKGGKRAAKSAGEGLNSLAGNWARSKTNQLKGKMLPLLGGKKILDAQGNVVGYQASFSMFGMKQSRTVTKDANGVWTLQKHTRRNSKVEKNFRKTIDANGNIGYEVILRDKLGRKIGTEKMIASTDSKGNMIYKSANGKSQLITDKNGKVIAFKRAKDSGLRTSDLHNGVTSTNDAFMKKRVITDDKGNVIGTDISFKNTTAKYLVNKDGSTNMHAYNQIMEGSLNKQDALEGMVLAHLDARGQGLDNRFQNRDVQMNEDGSLTIIQTDNDGSQHAINAQMVDGNMVISHQTADKLGNITRVKSNGVQTKKEKFTRQKDGSYKASVTYGFSDQTHSRSHLTNPLASDGVWGYGMDPNEAMKGFTANDYYAHVEQLKKREMGLGNTVINLNENEMRSVLNGSLDPFNPSSHNNDSNPQNETTPVSLNEHLKQTYADAQFSQIEKEAFQKFMQSKEGHKIISELQSMGVDSKTFQQVVRSTYKSKGDGKAEPEHMKNEINKAVELIKKTNEELLNPPQEQPSLSDQIIDNIIPQNNGQPPKDKKDPFQAFDEVDRNKNNLQVQMEKLREENERNKQLIEEAKEKSRQAERKMREEKSKQDEAWLKQHQENIRRQEEALKKAQEKLEALEREAEERRKQLELEAEEKRKQSKKEADKK